MRRYEAVIFDAGETLLHPHPSFLELIAEFIRERGHEIDASRVLAAEASLAEILTKMFADHALWSTSPERSRSFWASLYARFTDELGLDDDDLPDYLYDKFRDPKHYALFEDALPAISALKHAGYKIGVLSNFEAWLEGLLTSLEVLPLLDALVVSGVEGIEKPDPKIFTLALDRIGARPERAVYVGDSVTFDVEPASAVGMRAFLIDRRKRFRGDEHPVIRSLIELPEKLG
ncbi:MAG: HAD family hydrolase [Actinomycetota bacterium]|nr:HAD-IA family hydrolase [Actinomycetota bacterium]